MGDQTRHGTINWTIETLILIFRITGWENRNFPNFLENCNHENTALEFGSENRPFKIWSILILDQNSWFSRFYSDSSEFKSEVPRSKLNDSSTKILLWPQMTCHEWPQNPLEVKICCQKREIMLNHNEFPETYFYILKGMNPVNVR